MIQTLYALLALALTMLLVLNLQRGIQHTHGDQQFNEIATQVTGVGTDVLEAIDRRDFDKYVTDNKNTPPTCGRTSNAAVFTPEAAFGGAPVQCSDYAACPYVEGFYGLPTRAVYRDGLRYNVRVDTIRYVDPDTYAPSATQTFAKEVVLRITSPNLHLGNPSDTLSVRMSRVLTYDRVTDPTYIPYTPSGCAP